MDVVEESKSAATQHQTNATYVVYVYLHPRSQHGPKIDSETLVRRKLSHIYLHNITFVSGPLDIIWSVHLRAIQFFARWLPL